MKKSLFALATVLLACCAFGAPQYRVKLRASGYTGTETLENFPLLVRISPERIAGFAYADCAADGSDISFALEDGMVLAYDVDTWNAEGESLVWVSIPNFKDGISFYFRWKDASPQPSRATEVWSLANYKAVWHLGEASGDGLDATGNGCAAVPTGTKAETDCVRAAGDSPVGPARQLATADATGAKSVYLKMAALDSSVFDGDFTVSFWCNKTTSYASTWFANRTTAAGGAGVAGFGFSTTYWASGKQAYSAKGYGDSGSSATLFNQTLVLPVDAGWRHYAFTFTGTSMQCYQKGSSSASGTITRDANGSLATTAGFAFGSSTGGGDKAFVGQVDEIRISAGCKSANWIAAENALGVNPQFVTAVSARETLGACVDVVSSASVPFAAGGIPVYGVLPLMPGETLTLTAPAVGELDDGLTATCAGWRLVSAEDGSVLRTSETTSVVGENATTCILTDETAVRLEWMWTDVTPPEGAITYYVSPYGDNTDGLTWKTAFTHPQTAVDQAAGTAEKPATIRVGAGTYKAPAGVDPYTTLHIEKGNVSIISVDGPSATVLDGTKATNPKSSVAYRPLSIAAGLESVFIGGFTLRNGRRQNAANETAYWDLATSVAASSGVLSNMVVVVYGRNRVAPVFLNGTAAFVWSTVTTDTTTENNDYPNQLCNQLVRIGGSATVDHCVVRDVPPLSTIKLEQGQVQPVALVSANATLRNTLVTGCTVGTEGSTMISGGGAVYASAGTIESCTIAGNTCYGGPGGLYIADDNVICRDNVIYGNVSDKANLDLGIAAGKTPQITFCCSTDLTKDDVSHNQNANPSFVDAANGNYRLAIESLVAGKGLVLDDWMTEGTDLDGNPRIWTDGTVSMGCYEPQGRTSSLIVDFATSDGKTVGAAPYGVTFVPTVEGGDGTETYLWTFGDGASSTERSPTHVYSAAGVYDVTLRVSPTEGDPVEVSKPGLITTLGEACYVREGNAGVVPYDTWEKAASNIVDALALKPSRVVVTNGTYLVPAPNGLELDWPVIVESVEGPEQTVLDTGLRVTGYTALTGMTRRHLTMSHADAVLRGFRMIKGGNTALQITAGTMENCRFESYIGSAKQVSVVATDCVLKQCVFDFTGCSIGDFNINENANGVRLNGTALMDGCVVSNYVYREENSNINVGAKYGAVRLYGTAKMRNSFVTGCVFELPVTRPAAAVLVDGSGAAVENCTIVGNSVSDGGASVGNALGGGFYILGKNAVLANDIVWSNEVNGVRGDVCAADEPAQFANCLVDASADLPAAAGDCITGKDPLFLSDGAGYRLPLGSPCVNRGKMLDWCRQRGMATDIDGQERRRNRPDIGCFEYQQDLGLVILVN